MNTSLVLGNVPAKAGFKSAAGGSRLAGRRYT
jgi:hypothetical protein